MHVNITAYIEQHFYLAQWWTNRSKKLQDLHVNAEYCKQYIDIHNVQFCVIVYLVKTVKRKARELAEFNSMDNDK